MASQPKSPASCRARLPNNLIATNKTPEPGDADTRRPGLLSHCNPGPAQYSPENPGPEVAGLHPHSTMWVQFKDVVSYRAYRLNNIRATVRDSEILRIGKNVRRIKNLIPSLGKFDGSEPIALLKFLRALQEGFNTLRAPEGTAVRTMAFLLRGDAKNFYESRSQSATQIKGGSTMSELTWPRMVHAFIARYRTDDHLGTAYESVKRILQQPRNPRMGSRSASNETPRIAVSYLWSTSLCPILSKGCFQESVIRWQSR